MSICNICLESLNAPSGLVDAPVWGGVTNLNCLPRADDDGFTSGHFFHTFCINKWTENSCPTCRSPIIPENVTDYDSAPVPFLFPFGTPEQRVERRRQDAEREQRWMNAFHPYHRMVAERERAQRRVADRREQRRDQRRTTDRRVNPYRRYRRTRQSRRRSRRRKRKTRRTRRR